MRQSNDEKSGNTSLSHDFFHMLFEGADLYSAMWQPLLKTVGRWQLEVSGLSVKNGQAALAWSHDLARSWSPADAVAANVRYLDAVSSQFAQSSQRLAASVSRTVEAPVSKGVVPLPVKRTHDMIVLPDTEDFDVEPRKVA